ncbi:SDR family oxidoreductase [Nocardiopsis coralliicola]
MTDIDGRTVFITGGARGIGLGIARAFADAGARVAVADLSRDALGEAAADLGARTEAAAIELDVRDREAFARAVDEAEERLGPVGVLVNNAGITRMLPPAEMSYEVWDRVIGINLGGTVNGVQTVLPRLLERGSGGHIVNVASGAGLIGNTDLSYSASKYGVVGLSESLAVQPSLAAAGIGVTVVCPSFVQTRIAANSAEPDGAADPDPERTRRILDFFDRFGLPPEAVGRQVLDAVRGGRPYVITDRLLEERIRERADALVGAMPPATALEQETRAALHELFAAAQE